MYSVKIHSDICNTTRYLTFSGYIAAANCIEVLKGAGGRYTPEDYFEAGTLSRKPLGEVLNEHKPVHSDFVITYSHTTID